MIALCSKCYYIDNGKGEKKKFSTEGISKKQNELSRLRFKEVLEGRKARMRDGQMVTYELQKLGLSTYYDKRWVLDDGIHTEPMEFHL